ncbi:Dynein assembly factor 4, axonemal [Borealophlyctis nickersoniae]|nr:Dynein assembly factor 4, axonemal [Borealophlyctis nickersoniae]
MPIYIKDYSWSETDDEVYVSVPLKGVRASKADVYSNDVYIKVNFPPYLFEIDLFAPIDADAAVATVGDGYVKFVLPKQEAVTWGQLKTNLDSLEDVRKRRQDAADRALAKAEEARKEKARLQREEEQKLIQKQIEVERAERARVAALKEEEKRVAEASLQEWANQIKHTPTPSAQNSIPSDDSSPSPRKDSAIFHDDDVSPPEHATNGVSGADKNEDANVDEMEDDDDDDDDEAGLDMEAIRAKVRAQMKEKSRPPPRASGAEIEITFTSRGLIPTKTARESEDVKWQARITQAQEAHRKKTNADARGIEETSPIFLKDKGNAFYKSGNYAAAVNAYTAALEIDPANLVCLSNRAACHLHLFHAPSCIADCTTALSFITTQESTLRDQLVQDAEGDETRRKMRVKLLARRGAAKVTLGDVKGAKEDYKAAVELDPRNEGVKEDLERLSETVGAE